MWNKIKHYSYLIFVKKWLYVLLVVSLLAIDLITKALMENILKTQGSTITIIPNLFEFQLVYNTGSFSGWLGSDFGHVVLIIISFAGAIGIPYILVKYFNSMSIGMRIGLALCIPGDIGNLVDRLVYVNGKPRGVIDFLHFYIPSLNFNWPTFNFADMCLVVGVIVFAVFYIIYDTKQEKAKKLAQEKAIEETKKKMELDNNSTENKGESDGK